MTDVSDKNAIQESVLNFLADETGLDPDEVTVETGLFTSGELDSLDILKIVSFIEKTYGMSISPFEVSLQKLNSISLISDFVIKKAS